MEIGSIYSDSFWFRFAIFKFNKGMDGLIEPSSCFDVIKTSDDDLEFLIEFFGFFLDFTNMTIEKNQRLKVEKYLRSDFAARNSLFNKSSSDFWFITSDIALSEQELTIQVGDINFIKINNVNIFKTDKSQVF